MYSCFESITLRPLAGWQVRAACFLLALLVVGGTERAASAAHFFDYLHVEANEADSSGGHAAIRFGDQVFHFQHETPGILRIRRHESTAFEHAYAILGNRMIQSNSIAVSDETYTLLRDAFVRRLLTQDAQMEMRDRLHRDVALFELLLRERRKGDGSIAGISLPLKGLGFFLPDSPAPTDSFSPANPASSESGSPALSSLRENIRSAYGDRFIDERLALLRTTLRNMALKATESSVAAISPDSYPTFKPTASTRYEETLLTLHALQVLQAAPPLRPGTFWTSDSDTFRLTLQELHKLRVFAEQQQKNLMDLINSSRTDWGFPFILGMARLDAIEKSISSGRLVLLDVFPDNTRETYRYDTVVRPFLTAMEKERSKVFFLRRAEFFSEPSLREADYAALERSGNRLLEVDRAIATGSPLRIPPETPFPSRSAPGRAVLPRIDATVLEQELEAARKVERDYLAALSRLYAYDLLRQNCATEIFAVINQSMGSKSVAQGKSDHASTTDYELAKEDSIKRLGGFIDPSDGFVFIPFLSAGTVNDTYAVVARSEHPSYRSKRLAEMKEHESPFAVFLRESNTLTSTVYQAGPGDSTFLFFTDDTPLLRPLFGGFNLLTGMGASLLGLATMPIEGPDRFLSGVKGVFFSFPELAFVNLRKGTMAFVEQTAEYPLGKGTAELPRP